MTLAAVTLGLQDYAVIGGMMMAANVIVLAYLRSLSSRVDRVETRVAAVEKDKVDKHDWAREVVLTRGKMDRVSGQIATLDGKFDATVGVAANVGRLVDELAKRRNPGHG